MAGTRALIGGLVSGALASSGAPWIGRVQHDDVVVVVAARDLNPGVPIAAGDLYGLPVPAERLTDGVYVAPRDVVGRIPRERVLANELVRGERLAASEGGGLAAVPPGLRAISIVAPDIPVIAPFLEPGSVVDVLVIGSGPQPPTRTVVQALTVLGWAEGPDTEGARAGPPAAIQLLVTAEQAETLVHAEREGTFFVVLRAPLDVTAETWAMGPVRPCPGSPSARRGSLPDR